MSDKVKDETTDSKVPSWLRAEIKEICEKLNKGDSGFTVESFEVTKYGGVVEEMSEEVTIEDMERAIKEVEAEGYENVKVTHCRYWRRGMQ